MRIKMKGLRSCLLVTKPENQNYAAELSWLSPTLRGNYGRGGVGINDVPGFG